MTAEYIIVYITAPNEDEAAKIARALVEESLAGCVNIIRGIRSIYRWQGKIEDEEEALLIAKTRGELFAKLEEKVKKIHPYSVPEIIAVPVLRGQKDYLDWLSACTA